MAAPATTAQAFTGLTTVEATRLLGIHGSNEIATGRRRSLGRIVLETPSFETAAMSKAFNAAVRVAGKVSFLDVAGGPFRTSLQPSPGQGLKVK